MTVRKPIERPGVMFARNLVLDAVFIVLCWSAVCGFAADDYKATLATIKAANSWTPEKKIPRQLLKYQHNREDGSCFGNPNSTESIFNCISNYSLLRATAFLPDIHMGVFSNAITSALVFGGPGRFFTDVAAWLTERPALIKQPRFKVLSEQMRVKHIVVDSLYVTYADMSPEAGKQVLEEMRAELQRGRPWGEVYLEFSKKYEHPYEDRLGDGMVIRGTRTKIGNLGDFVLAENGDERFCYRTFWMPKQHISRLFAARPAEVLILFDKEDLTRFPDLYEKETGERHVLHRVREVFTGK